MRLQLLSLIMFLLFVVVDMNRKTLIKSEQTILMTAKVEQAAAASSVSNHQLTRTTSPGVVLHYQAYNIDSSNGSVISDKSPSEYRKKRASGVGEEGMQISPVLTLKVTDAFNRPLMGSEGPTELRAGDYVRFIITLTRDGTYNSLEVTRCTMSTSLTMPDPKAETRVLLIKGCPIQDEATADSWYWTSEMSTNSTFITNTQPVPIFRLSSSEYVYLHCSMKMCFFGQAPCQQPTRDDCLVLESKRKKREEDIQPVRRRRRDSTDGNVTDVDQTIALRVIDPRLTPTSNNPFEVGTSGFIALIVLISIIGIAVIILIIILVVTLADRRPKRKRISQPQQFTQQRVTPANRRCPTCC